MKVIIFPGDSDTVSIVYPTEEFQDSLEFVVSRSVPEGKPHRIVDLEDLPSPETRKRWRWAANGEVVVGEDTTPAVDPDTEISRFQAKAALEMTGNLERATAIVNRSSKLVQLAWEDAQVFKYSSPMLNQLALSPAPEGLGLTRKQYVDLFNLAATIEV